MKNQATTTSVGQDLNNAHAEDTRLDGTLAVDKATLGMLIKTDRACGSKHPLHIQGAEGPAP